MENSIFIGVCSILNVAMFAMWIKLDVTSASYSTEHIFSNNHCLSLPSITFCAHCRADAMFASRCVMSPCTAYARATAS